MHAGSRKAAPAGAAAKEVDSKAKAALSSMTSRDAQMYPGKGNKTNGNPQGNPGSKK